MPVVPLPVLPSTWNELNLPWAPAESKALGQGSLAGREGADTGTDGSWNISWRSKDRLLWPTKETHCKVKTSWEPVVWTNSQMTADLSRTGGVSPSSGKQRVSWSLFYVLPATAEPNAIFHPLTNEQWGRNRKPAVHVELKKLPFSL